MHLLIGNQIDSLALKLNKKYGNVVGVELNGEYNFFTAHLL
jgi:uncharacterized protein YaiE (UPF0345 family)